MAKNNSEDDILDKYQDVVNDDGNEFDKEKDQRDSFSQKDGFKTKNYNQIQTDKDNIKKKYIRLSIVGGVLLLLIISFIGAYIKLNSTDKYASDANVGIQDNIESGNPTDVQNELLKKQMERMQEQLDIMRNEQNLTRQQINQSQLNIGNTLLDANRTADGNYTSQSIDQTRMALENEIASLKSELNASKNKESLPQLSPDIKNEISSAKEIDVAKQQYQKSKFKTKNVKTYSEYNVESMGDFDKDVNVVVDANGTVVNKENVTFDITTGLSKGLLVTGVQAATFSSGEQNPKPVMVSFSSPILVANGQQIDVSDCTALGTAIGNMNSKRAEITLTRLSCNVEIDKKAYKVSQKITAYLIGEDGEFGVPGRLVDSGAQVVMKQLQMGFLQGVNQAFQTAVQPNVTFSGGGVYGPNIAQSGVAAGANTGLNALVQYYQRMMDGMYPTISVRAGRNVGIFWPGGEVLEVTATRFFSAEKGMLNKKAKNASYKRNLPFPDDNNKEGVVTDEW
ncbi:TrbI/VirB10 family protein [Aquamicrobium sp.]|uniref:TrbI/VirB10 family protein n=1 Tax=Aquamicrobium sp. TaxID=1872579 RepID=UPI002589D03E|nr:TrbI/VirB10 family protein [Aquamicrobium sp.]MCK9549286.1 hypothetical protein [Aquamicrobium sp.]